MKTKVFLIALCIFSLSHIVNAEEPLKFGDKLEVPALPKIEVLDYKELRSREICSMAKAEGLNNCELMIAHLVSECGSMDEYCSWQKGSTKSDYGYAIGIAQWHVCWRHFDWANKHGYCWKDKDGRMHHGISNAPKMRDHFFNDFPEMRDWRFQAKRYIGEIRSCMDEFRTLDFCIDTWNSDPSYMKRVYSKLHVAQSLLGS